MYDKNGQVRHVMRRGRAFLFFSCLFLADPALIAAAHARDSFPVMGDLGDALRRYAIRTGKQLIFDPELVRGKKLRKATASSASLTSMLRGTGLKARFLDQGLVLIEKEPAPLVAPVVPSKVVETGPALPGQDIVVTALKRPSLLNQTPGTIRAARGDSLSARAIFGLGDLARVMPDVAIINSRSGEQRIAIRGIYGTGEPTVGVYYGETAVSGPSGTTFDSGGVTPDVDLIDVNRMEVLHGPQGTLYGASSMGGTLRVLFNQPDSSGWSASATMGTEISSGGEPGYEASLVLNAPIVADRLAARAVLYRRTSSRFTDKPALGIEDVGAVQRRGERVSLSWTPSPSARLTALFLSHRLSLDDGTSWHADVGRHSNRDRVRTPYGSNLKLGNLTGELDIDDVGTLLVTASRYRWDLLRQNDFSAIVAGQMGSPQGCARLFAIGPGGRCTMEQMGAFAGYVQSRMPATLYQPMSVSSSSGEIRLSSDDSGALLWTIGGFFEDRRDETYSYVVLADPQNGTINQPLDITGLRTIGLKLRQRAAFGEVSYRFMPDWTATFGMRRFHYRVGAQGAVPIPNIITGTALLEQGAYQTKETGSSLKFGLNYRPGADVMLYAQAAQGFRPGGVNITPGLTDAERAYQADRLWSYEIGFKKQMRDRGSINIALFHIDWDDMIYFASSANGAFTYNTNIGQVAVNGVEIQADYRLTSQLSIDARLGYVDAQLVGDGLLAGGGHDGDRLPDISPLTWAVGLNWRPLPGGVAGQSLSFMAGAHGISGANSKFNAGLPYYEHLPAHILVDAGVQWGQAGWMLTLSAQNLFNGAGATRITSSAFGMREVYGSKPRSLVARLSYDF